MSAPFWQMMSQAPRPATWPATAWYGAVRLNGRPSDRRRRGPMLRVIAAKDRRESNGSLAVEFADFAAAEAIRTEWLALVDRALEPNVFAEPAFALAAAQHLSTTKRPSFILVRDRESRALLGLWPIEPRPDAWQPGLVRAWSTEQAVLGVPVIDRSRAAEVTDAVMDAVTERFGQRALVLIPQLPKAGPTYGLLVSRALARGQTWAALSPTTRATLTAGGNADTIFRRAASSKHHKEMMRLRRRLEALGTVSYRSADNPREIAAAAEHFLALEAKGWKGRRATALLSDPGSAAFTRAMVRQMAHGGQCRIDSLELDGQPIAMAVILKSQGRAYYWKTAFDEAFQRYSPGVQLTIELTHKQLADPTVIVTDSCAIANHPMIDRLWCDRQEIVDLAIAASPGAQTGAQSVLRRETVRRQARTWAKQVAHMIAAHPLANRVLLGRRMSPT